MENELGLFFKSHDFGLKAMATNFVLIGQGQGLVDCIRLHKVKNINDNNTSKCAGHSCDTKLL